MKILLTGSRDWAKRGPVVALMSGLYKDGAEFILGDCPTGLDMIALKTCEDLDYAHKKFIAGWNVHTDGCYCRDKAPGSRAYCAGPRRNGHMVGYAVQNLAGGAVCFAFRTDGVSKGTDDCMEQARQAGIPIYLLRNLPPYP